jgi:voltage-gated potassium channel
MKKPIFGMGLTAILVIPLVVGTFGYVTIEGWPVLDGLYMSIITLSTVGYGETQELTKEGRVFTTVLIGISMMSMAWWTAGITSMFVGGQLSGAFQKQKEAKMISRLSNHTVVCGGGLFARTVIDQLVRNDKDVVAIIGCEEEIALMRRFYPDLLIVKGDPKSEMSLADANTVSAEYLVAAVESDYDNLLIAITGKGLGTGVKIIACAQGNELASRMLKVGADQVVCPFVLAGEQAAEMIA